MTQKNLSPFGLAAVELDGDFAELQEFGGQLERLVLESDAGLERARALLVKFSACGQRVGEGLQTLARTLEEARNNAEKTAAAVSLKAVAIQERQRATEAMLARFQALGEMFKQITSEITELQKPSGDGLNSDEKARLVQHLPQVDTQLNELAENARKLRDDARDAQMKALEKNADSLAQSLVSMRGKLGSFIERAPAPQNLH